MANVIIEYEKQLPSLYGIVASRNLPISDRALQEISFWKGKKETSSGTYSRLKRYWESANWREGKWSATGTPWSAAFISYILRGQMPGAGAHYQYVQSAMRGKHGWRAISIPKNKRQIKVAVGDVLVRPRSGGTTNSHGDVIYRIANGKAYLAGGNIGDTAKTSSVLTLHDGTLLDDAGNYLILLKKNPKLLSATGNKILAYGGFTVALGLTGLLAYNVAKRKGLITGSPNQPLTLYKTGETHTNGMDVYRKVGDRPKKGKWGMLGGTYYLSDAYTDGWGTYHPAAMLVTDKPYRDAYGTHDGEPSHPLEQPYQIVPKKGG